MALKIDKNPIEEYPDIQSVLAEQIIKQPINQLLKKSNKNNSPTIKFKINPKNPEILDIITIPSFNYVTLKFHKEIKNRIDMLEL